MGYRTTVSEAGPRWRLRHLRLVGGIGLQEPRIFVEVKHRAASMGAPEVRSFLDARQPGDRYLS